MILEKVQHLHLYKPLAVLYTCNIIYNFSILKTSYFIDASFKKRKALIPCIGYLRSMNPFFRTQNNNLNENESQFSFLWF